jgi:DNA-binding transcriptional regulator YiaG
MKLNNGQKVRKIRHKLGLTQAELASLLFLATRTVERWEVGERNCSSAYLQQVEMIAEKLKLKN